MKRQAVADSAAQLSQLQRALTDTDVVYQVVKTENNKVTSQISAVIQRESEMREKIKILFNEIEVITWALFAKRRESRSHYTDFIRYRYMQTERKIDCCSSFFFSPLLFILLSHAS